jgi:hypothetical protein
MKKIIPWLVVAVVLLIGGYAIGRYKVNAAVAEAKAQAEQEKAQALAGQIKALGDQIAKSEAALAEFQKNAAAREQWFQIELTKVNHATPAQLVDQGSAILGVADITTDGVKVSTSIGTYRLIVASLLDLKEYRETREPGWKVERGMLNDQINALKAQAALDAQKDAAIAASIADLKKYISAQKTASTLDKVLWAGAGIGAGLLAGHFMK